MSDFQQAMMWLKEGKKVQRSCWQSSYLFLDKSEGEGNYEIRGDVHGTIKIGVSYYSIEATDWEVYEEKPELKTLKDMESRDVVLGKPYEWTIRESEMKAEAIKEIKYLRVWKGQGAIKLLPWITTTDFGNTGLNAIIEYLKWKNNFSEEDLK